ncbi:D-cysteine desulfhydrase family protein [Vibrio hyugaensis]|uniref:D-cysteine desulfhydrase family protein n=1 Tax=Vibrio hyugaensis TaxID=1534743 RepID=UPI001FD57606|nr:D-cysteine desulfhydrase family protein [Vibrio hyugaensis]
MYKTKLSERVEILPGRTPIEFAPRLSKMLGCNLFFKRDDCTGLAGGGNKARKLEYLVADALIKGADTLITFGGIQSNHARQTAAAAAKFGLHCELILEHIDAHSELEYYKNGNALLDNLLGANVHVLSSEQTASEYSVQLTSKLAKQGRKPYLIPVGGSNILGSYGYVRCAYEIIQQLNEQDLSIDKIVLASGSGGTHAGLLAGLISSHVEIPVLGVSISRNKENQELLVGELLKSILLKLGEPQQNTAGKVMIDDHYLGEGYGKTTESMFAAVKTCAECEGILLDPVYTGKAMAGLIDYCETEKIEKGATYCLFIQEEHKAYTLIVMRSISSR